MIRVLIKRTIIEGLESNYEHTILELLDHAAATPGYIRGESFRDYHKRNEYVVISTWSSLNAWNLWLRSEARADMINKLGPFLQEREQFTVLEPCVYVRA